MAHKEVRCIFSVSSLLAGMKVAERYAYAYPTLTHREAKDQYTIYFRPTLTFIAGASNKAHLIMMF